MDSVLSELPLPSTYQEIIDLSLALWSTLVEQIRKLQNEELQEWVQRSLFYLTNLSQKKGSANFIRISLGLLCVSKFFQIDFSQLEPLIQTLYTTNEMVSMQFAAYSIAKICSELPTNEVSFSKKQIEMAFSLLKPEKSSSQNHLFGLFMLRELSHFIPLIFLLNSVDLPEYIWSFLINSSTEIRVTASQVLERYLSILVKYQGYRLKEIFNNIFNKAICHLLNSPSDCPQGVLVVLQMLIKKKGLFFQNRAQTVFPTIYDLLKAKPDVRSSAIALIAQLSEIDSELFNEDVFSNFFEIIQKSDELCMETSMVALSLLIRNVPQHFSNKEIVLFRMCQTALKQKRLNLVDSLFDVLFSIASFMPRVFSSSSFHLWELIYENVFHEKFLILFPVILKTVQDFWPKWSVKICEQIIDILQKGTEHSNLPKKIVALKLIPLLPQTLSSHKSTMISVLRSFLTSKSEAPRNLAPKALLHLTLNSSVIEIHQSLHQILEIATGDDSEEVRVSSLSSFSNQHYRLLSNHIFLDLFSLLSNDVSPRVRSACFNVLKAVRVYYPLGIDVILRHSLNDSFFSLQCSTSLSMQAQIAQVMPSLVSASPKLFRIYSSTYIPIILDLLSRRFYKTDTIFVNPLDPEYRTQLALSLISTIHDIIAADVKMLEPFQSRLFPILATIIGEWGDKRLKHEVLSTITEFVSKKGSPFEIIQNSPGLIPSVFSFIESSNSRSLRVKALKFTGLCGALSTKNMQLNSSLSRSNAPSLPDLFLVGNILSYNDYFVETVFLQLNQILSDKSLQNLRMKTLTAAIEALDIQSTTPSGFFCKLVPLVLSEIENSNGDQLNEALVLLQRLVFVAGQRIVHFVKPIMACIHKVWKTSVIPHLLTIIAAIVDQVGSDFTPFAAQLISNLLDVISTSLLSKPADAVKCIPLLASICPALPHLSELMIPNICFVALQDNSPKEIKLTSLNSLRFLVQNTSINSNSASILRSSLAYCVSTDKELSNSAFQVLYSLMLKLGSGFNIYTHRTVTKLTQHKMLTDEFRQINAAMMSGKEIIISDFGFINTDSLLVFSSEKSRNCYEPNPRIFLEEFDTQNMTTPKHWQNWFSNFEVRFIRESPSIPIRSCYELASVYRSLASSLFFPAFLSCWILMSSDIQAALSLKISLLVTKNTLPPDVFQRLARLCEYMDRAEKPLLISQNTLTPFFVSAKCTALALHNEEERFISNRCVPSPTTISTIVELYSSLGRSDAAKSLLKSPCDYNEWLLKLEQWPAAFRHYKEQLDLTPDDEDAFFGYIISCSKLRQYDFIRKREKEFRRLSEKIQASISSKFAEAFFFGNDYEKMHEYCKKCPVDSIEAQILKSLSLILLGKSDEANISINNSYGLVATQNSAMFGRRYEAFYGNLLNCQVLYELLEMNLLNRKVNIAQWRKRLSSVEYTSEVWWPLIMVRMATLPRDDHVFIGFLELILQERKLEVFQSTFNLFFPGFNMNNGDPLVSLQQIRYIWFKGERIPAVNYLRNLFLASSNSPHLPALLAQYVDWNLTASDRSTESLQDAIKWLKKVLSPQQSYSIIWQRWASVNYLMFGKSPSNKQFAIESIKGYIHFITQYRESPGSCFSEVVQLLSLFFATANDNDTFSKMAPLVKNISSNHFIDTIPQLIAQLSHKSDDTVSFVQNILIEIGKTHHQALLFPLLVARISPDSRRQHAANGVLDMITKEKSKVVQQAQIIQNCLLLAATTVFEHSISIIIKYFEHIALNCITEANKDLANLKSLIKTPTYSLDRMFYQVNYSLLPLLFNCKENDTQIEAILREMLANIENFLDKLSVLHSNEVCPELNKLIDTEVAVPGAHDNAMIQSFVPSFDVLGSKKRPRMAQVNGTDGQIYKYLLKGNEDLRLDQRVMQFFKLINTHIRRNYSLAINKVTIRNYDIVPLSHAVGLIQWVDGCDTYHNLISEYRYWHQKHINIEHDIMTEHSISSIDSLLPIQRFETMREVENICDNGDLRKVMWLKSSSSDTWLERVTHFSRSAGLMSIIGYVLGLGDRHPSNIMIDRNTGDVVHIDFGDCFEIASSRILFPELIPFRLTRMMISAFGVCGIEGDFRPVCEKVMMLIRENCNSLVSVLEIFVQEPISDGESVLQADKIMKRVWEKITGDDEGQQKNISVQVESLIIEATKDYNHSLLYSGWCPLW